MASVSIRPACAAEKAGRIALTPELLAATGARYSRNNEGLESIASRIDPENPDASVDSIFRMLDYGHQSIADMVPVAMFMDGISIWLAYRIWALSPTAGGQESSTRYIRMGAESLPDADSLGIGENLRGEWRRGMEEAFRAYGDLLGLWGGLAAERPGLVRLPPSLLADASPKAEKQAQRIRRNYAFDRARYFIPAAAKTNVMMVMSARSWSQLSGYLLSSMLPEANRLGEAIQRELALSAPHLLRHSGATEDRIAGLRDEFGQRMIAASAASSLPMGEASCRAFLDVFPPEGVGNAEMADALRHHSNRYAWQGSALLRTSVRFGWDAVALAEIRDMNRHRTGSKHSSLVPKGFYCARDQLPEGTDFLCGRSSVGERLTARALELLAKGDPGYVYWTLLGTQFDFEHSTAADKFIYEAELRTGMGAHYRYAKHYHDALVLWYGKYPETREFVSEGDAEPE